MRLIDADALLKHEIEADRMGAMLVVGKGRILSAPTIDALNSPWVKASDRLPTREDGVLVLVRQRGYCFSENNHDSDTSLKWWDEVVRACSPDVQRIGAPRDWWWMPIPPLPEVEE